MDTPTERMIDAAAKELWVATRGENTKDWDELSGWAQYKLRATAMRVLGAAKEASVLTEREWEDMVEGTG